MQRFCETTLNLLVAGVLLGSATAQQTTGTTSTTAAKPRQSTTTAAGARRKATPGTTAAKPKTMVLTTEQEKASYAIGLSVGKGLHRDSIDVAPEYFLQGLKDALADGKVLLTDDQIKTVMMGLQTQVRAKQEAKRQAQIETNKKEGTAFLAENATKPGVTKLPSGLEYKVLTAGTGPKPTATDSVVCNYRGTLLDGTEFDSSYKRGQPATFPVSGVIRGWTEALQLMPTGSKWQLFVPADLAYGDHGQGPIGPNATLIFDVELLSIQDKNPPAAAPALDPPATPPPAAATPPPATAPSTNPTP